MPLLWRLLAGLLAGSMPAPASTSPTPLVSRSDNGVNNPTYCNDHYPALFTAIGELCSREDRFIVGNNWTWAESPGVPHRGQFIIQAACESEDTGPPEDITDVCLSIGLAMCRVRIDHGRAVGLNRGKLDCQQWFIPGWNDRNFSGYEWSGMKILRMEDILPGGMTGELKDEVLTSLHTSRSMLVPTSSNLSTTKSQAKTSSSPRSTSPTPEPSQSTEGDHHRTIPLTTTITLRTTVARTSTSNSDRGHAK